MEAHTSRLTGSAKAGDFKSAGVVFSKGEVLYSRLRPYLNKVWKADREGIASAEFLVLRPQTAISAEYLRRRIMTPDFLAFAASLDRGDRPRVDYEQISRFEIDLPPLAEQRRIVAKLDALTARTARARADLDRIPALTARYKQAVLASELHGGGPAPEGERFEMRPLSSVLISTFYGPRFGAEQYAAGGTPTLRTTDFGDWGEVRPRAPPCVAVSDKDYQKWGLLDGDILVTRTGSIGKCALYEDSIGRALPSAYLIRVRLDQALVEPRFVLLALLSDSGQEQLGLGITAVTQPNINAGVIERLRLPVPPLAEQREIVRRIATAFAEIDRIAAEAAAARRLLDRLDQAVLAKAFRGELVPQDPADEPAAALLARLRTARAAAPKPKRGRRASAA